MLQGKRIIITGGLGFIGSNIAEALVKENEVVIIDNQSTGKMENVEDILTNLKVIKGNVQNLDLTDIFQGFDYVFHQAALPSVSRSIEDPASSNDSNINGTLNVLIAARDSGIKKVVFASSSSVYGDTPTLPKVESMPINPLSPYAITKATGELYCQVFYKIYGLPTTSLRYFNVFGPRQDPNSQYSAVIPRFIKAIKNDESPIVYGDGEQSRDFTFVDHVVKANILACESSETGVFNVACGRRLTINQLIDIINEVLGNDIAPKYIEQRPGDIKHSLADITKAKSIGYNPNGNFVEEIKATVRWFESWMK